jgi:hypothetical protein
MLKLFGSRGSANSVAASTRSETDQDNAPPEFVQIDEANPFPLAAHIARANGFPYVDWKAVESWAAALPEEEQAQAWFSCARGWLLHLRAALGQQYRLDLAKHALLLSTLEPPIARDTLDFMERTTGRIVRLLDGIASPPKRGESILVVFDDEESYYNYIAYFYPERGEFAQSGGLYIDAGCGHFVTVKSDLPSVEPVIAHEMTHASVAGLPLPLWLNEGLAVNSERALTMPQRGLYSPVELHEKHVAFWNAEEIQRFWSGESFDVGGDSNMLAYDLAQIIVEQMAKDWTSFRRFVLAADRADGGAAAAREHLAVDLGEYVCALLEQQNTSGWSPDPSGWRPEYTQDQATQA